MHRHVGIMALMLLLLSSAAVVSAAITILDFQCPDTVVDVSANDNGGNLTLSAGTNKTYVLANGTYTINSELTVAENNTCYVAAEGANVTVVARFDEGYAWVVSQGATLGLQGFTLRGEGRINVAGEGAGGVSVGPSTRLVASNISFVGLGRDQDPGAVRISAGTLDAANVLFDSCFVRQSVAGGALDVSGGGGATLTQASSRLCVEQQSLNAVVQRSKTRVYLQKFDATGYHTLSRLLVSSSCYEHSVLLRTRPKGASPAKASTLHRSRSPRAGFTGQG